MQTPNTKDLEKIIQNELNYLEKEGVVIKMSNGKYRMKTKKEINQEIKNIQ